TTPSPTWTRCVCRCRRSTPPTRSAAAWATRSGWSCTAPQACARPSSARSTRNSATSSSTCPAGSTACAELRDPLPHPEELGDGGHTAGRRPAVTVGVDGVGHGVVRGGVVKQFPHAVDDIPADRTHELHRAGRDGLGTFGVL